MKICSARTSVPQEVDNCSRSSVMIGTPRNVVPYKDDTVLLPHFVATALIDFLKSVRGVYRERTLYRKDVHSWLSGVKNDCNPLCALLSLPGLTIESNHVRGPRHCKLEKTRRDDRRRDCEREVECCRLLLSMGVSAFLPDKTGRIPVVTVALGGDDNGPSLLLEMLSHLPLHHHSDPHSSSNNNNSNSTFRTDENDQNVNPATLPVRMQRRGILEGDAFKYLVWHVLMVCPARDTSPSSIPCDNQNDNDMGWDVLDCANDENISKDMKGLRKDMKGLKQSQSKISNTTQRLLNAEHAGRNRIQVAILSILLDCGFPGNNNN